MSESIHMLIEQYGLVALFVACMFEGETVAVVAGYFAHQGTVAAWPAFAVIFAGTVLSDTAYFLASRYFSARPFVARVMAKPGFARARDLMDRHPAAFVVLRRFAYGVHPITGLASGLSSMRLATFMALDVAASAVWTAIFCGLGYFFGLGVQRAVGEALEHHERLIGAIAAGLVGLLIAVYVLRRFSHRHIHGTAS